MKIEGFITGQPLSGEGVGQAIFQLMPSLPHESPIPMPRALAKVLFPQGFVPGRFPVLPVAAQAPAPTLIPPAGMPVQPPAAQPPMPPAQPAAQPPVAPLTRPISSGGELITARSQRIRIRERAGL